MITSSASSRASSSLKLTDEVRKDIEFSSQNEQLTMKSKKKRAKVLKRAKKPWKWGHLTGKSMNRSVVKKEKKSRLRRRKCEGSYKEVKSSELCKQEAILKRDKAQTEEGIFINNIILKVSGFLNSSSSIYSNYSKVASLHKNLWRWLSWYLSHQNMRLKTLQNRFYEKKIVLSQH